MGAIVLTGPTATGKTDCSLEIARETFEIVSCDSVQVYRYLDIGSGKLQESERQNVPHHCIDIVNPDEDFTAGDYVKSAVSAVEKITRNGKIPLFIGGTGFYIDAFFQGLSRVPDVPVSLRNEVEQELAEGGAEKMHRELFNVDPEFARKVHVNDHQRIVRGISVYRLEHRPLSSYYGEKKGYESDKTLYIGLWAEKDILIERINNRVDSMLQMGFLDEVKELRKWGYGSKLKSMQSIGYLELNQFIDGEISLDEAVERIKIETRRYAKRQMTWFRKNQRMEWFHLNERDRLSDRVHSWLEHKKIEEK